MQKQLIEQIKNFSLKELKELEKYDLQYQALENLYKNLKDKELFLKLIIINALLSYQLTMKWEKYWTYFSEYFSKNKIDNLKQNFQDFLSKYNKRLLNAKFKRLDKILSFIKSLDKKNIQEYIKNDLKLLEDLAKHINQKKDAKTIVFAVKMFIWWIQIIWYDKIPSLWIYIPVDNRIWKISKNKNFWLEIEEKTWYPLLLLDTLFYISLWWDLENIRNQKLKNKIIQIKNFLINL